MSDLTQMRLLINLAQVDGGVAEQERNFIINIGRAHGIYPDETKALFDQHHDVIVPSNLNSEQKFNYLITLVQLMKIDERMYQEEIRFCGKIASRLGYDQEIMFDLMLHVRSSPMDEAEIANLKLLTDKYRQS